MMEKSETTPIMSGYPDPKSKNKEEWVEFFSKLLKEKTVELLLVPQELPSGKTVVQTLVDSPEKLVHPNPVAPILMSNSATSVSDITFRNIGKKVGVVLRPCEIRAVVELVKLKQITMENLYIIGVDCLGTFEYRDFAKILEKEKDIDTLTEKFINPALSTAKDGDVARKGGVKGELNYQIRDACKACIYPIPQNVQYRITLVEDTDKFIEQRKKNREVIYKDIREKISSIKGLLSELAGCRRCYNCRRECPVCYCRECIFDTVTFEHTPEQYLRWIGRKGIIRMPADTLLFHLTRMNHMITSCVACGQCTSACPNDIQVAKIFSAVGEKVQALFDYVAGRRLDEELPQATFREEELQPR